MNEREQTDERTTGNGAVDAETGADLSGGALGGGHDDGTPELHRVRVPKANRYGQIFDGVIFHMEQRDRVYTGVGRASRRVAAVSAILAGGFAAVPATIYAVKEGNRKPYLEVSFVGNRQVQAITPLDAESKTELAAWKRAVAETAKAWLVASGGIGSVKANDDTVEADGLDLTFD